MPCSRRKLGPSGGETFDFLGFTHHWGKTRKGKVAVQRRTMRTRLARALRAVSIWCREHRRWKVTEQAQHLARKMLGHYAYYTSTFNSSAAAAATFLGNLAGRRRAAS